MIIFKRILFIFLGMLTLAILVILALPSPIQAEAWHPQAPPSIDPVVYQAETIQSINIGQPEDVAFDAQGRLYAGSSDGNIYQIALGAENTFEEAVHLGRTGGFPLGIHFDAEGLLVVAVKELGLYTVSTGGEVTLLTNQVEGTSITYADEVDIAEDGTIYFTDASTRFHFGWPNDLLEATPNGRVLAYDPTTKETTIIRDALYHPNGIIVSPDQSHLLVAESFRYQIRRIWLTGESAGESDIIAENIPIIPDNMSLDKNNLLWIAGRPRSNFLDNMHRYPFFKNQIAKLGEANLRSAQSSLRTGIILHMTLNGSIQQVIEINGISGLSSAQPEGEYLYLGTIVEETIARVKLPESVSSSP